MNIQNNINYEYLIVQFFTFITKSKYSFLSESYVERYIIYTVYFKS